jgi:hypothetical protein
VHRGHLWKSPKRPLGRPRRKGVDNIKIDLREREDEVMEHSCESGNGPSSSMNCCEILG